MKLFAMTTLSPVSSIQCLVSSVKYIASIKILSALLIINSLFLYPMKYHFFFSIFAFIIVFAQFSSAQNGIDSIGLEIELMDFPTMPALHSYASAQHENYWVFIGGRRDGLHGQFPATSYNLNSANDSIYIVDINTLDIWSYPTNNFPTTIKNQFNAANFQNYNENESMWIIGGYGWSEGENKKISFPYLTEIEIEPFIDAIKVGNDPLPFIHQIQDDRLAITGGNMSKLGDYFYLVMGHNFSRDYNSFDKFSYDQVYANDIKKFTMSYDGNGILNGINDYEAEEDTMHYHKRDFNLVPFIQADRNPALMAYSGVFQYTSNLPWLDCVAISESGNYVYEGFEQLLSQYHCPTLPIYDSLHNNMQTIFFGGMGLYHWYENEPVIVDSLIPFVKTISTVIRKADGSMKEELLPITMPELEGTNAHFFYTTDAPIYSNGILDLNKLSDGQKTLVGYIHGGIIADEPNVFEIIGSGFSSASNRIYKVYITRTADVETAIHSPSLISPISNISLGPNPCYDQLNISFDFNIGPYIEYELWNIKGQSVIPPKRINSKGNTTVSLDMKNLANGYYYLSLKNGSYLRTFLIEKL